MTSTLFTRVCRAEPFLYETMAGPDVYETRERNLPDVLSHLTRRIEELCGEVNGNLEASERYKSAKCSSGTLVKRMRERSQAVATEIAKREYQALESAVIAEANVPQISHIDSHPAAEERVSGSASKKFGQVSLESGLTQL